jgi:hypothetical protein
MLRKHNHTKSDLSLDSSLFQLDKPKDDPKDEIVNKLLKDTE